MVDLKGRKVTELVGVGNIFYGSLTNIDLFRILNPFTGADCSVVNYRFSYQNSEQDIELYGVSGAFTTYFRELDVRVCRWFSLDPKTANTPWESPYVSMGDNPILLNDILGDYVGYKKFGDFLRVQLKCLTNKDFRDIHKTRKEDKQNTFIYEKKDGLYPPLEDAGPFNYPAVGTPHDGSKKNSMRYPIYYNSSFPFPIFDFPSINIEFASEIKIFEKKPVEESKDYKVLANSKGQRFILRRLKPGEDITFWPKGKMDKVEIIDDDGIISNFSIVNNKTLKYPDIVINSENYAFPNFSPKLIIKITTLNPDILANGDPERGPSVSKGSFYYTRFRGFNLSIPLPSIKFK